jgi:DNA helicase-2/ATP-dependent DNA helicase PcrA
MTVDFSSLNENQLKAVTWTQGPLLVLAGPGSGKTAVLSCRISHLISQSPDKRFRVVGLTFTNKAAIEMRDRVNDILGAGSERALLTTFHAFAADILRQHGSHLGISPDFSILNSDEDRAEIFADAVNTSSQMSPLINEADVALLPLLTNLIEKRVDESAIANRIRDPELATKLAILQTAYTRELQEHNALDFPLLINLACDLLTKNPAIARHFRTVYPYICVDEFQDTNVGQFEFLRSLIGTDPKGLFVVADDDQVVYQWNGANPARLLALRTEFKMATLELPQNYRCPKPIIEIANNLISHNPNRTKDTIPLWSSKSPISPEPVRTKTLVSPDDEAKWVAKDIKKLPTHELEFCAVLGRTKTMVERVAAALQAEGLNVTMSVKKNEFVSSPLKWLHSMLRLANARGDKEQLRRVSSSFYDLEGIQLPPKDVLAASSAIGGDLFRAWIGEALARSSDLDDQCVSLLKLAQKDLGERMAYSAFVKAVFPWFEFLATGGALAGSTATAESFSDYEEEHTVWLELCDSISRRHATDEPSLNLLLQEMDLMPKQAPAPSNAVRCYTIHTAKGMEFDHVYLVGLAEDILPSYQSTKKGPLSLEMQEERRNCFVAVTRTRKCLTLTRSQYYFGYEKQPSRFLREMGLKPF